MPIEIRELIIKTSIVEGKPEASRPQGTISKKELEKLKKEIIELCMEEIVDKLNKEKER